MSLIRNFRNKVCEKCFFCRSLCFCPLCKQCPQCCKCPTSGRSSPRVLAKMAPLGRKSESNIHFKGRLCSPIQSQTPTGSRPFDSQWLCKPHQEPLPEGGFASTTQEKGSREGQGSDLSRLFQQTIHCPQTKSKMAANPRPQCAEQVSERQNFQDGNPGNNKALPSARGVGNLAGFQRRLLPHPCSQPVQEVPPVPFSKSDLSVPGTSLWPIRTSYGVHGSGQRSKADGSIPGYKNPPVPRRLVDSSPHQRILPSGHPVSSRPLSVPLLGDKLTEIGVGPNSSVRVRRLQIRPLTRTSKTNPSTLGIYPSEDSLHYVQSDMPGQDFYVPNRPSNGNRETSASRETPHEAHPVALEKSVEDSRIVGERDPHSEIPPSASPVVDQRDECPSGSTSPPHASCNTNLYRRLKRRLGCSLRRLHRKRHLVTSRKPSSHQLPGTKGRLTGTKTVPSSSARKSRSGRHRQHYSCGLHQQGGRYEVRLTLCPSLAPSLLVQPETGHPKSPTHSRPSECHCRQIVKTRPSHSNRVVSPSRCNQPSVSDMAPSADRHVCDKVQLQTGAICVPSARSSGLGSGRPISMLGEPGHVCLPTDISPGQGSEQTIRPLLQESHSDSPRLAQHAMVLGSSGNVIPNPSVPSTSSRPSNSALQQGASQELEQPKSPCLAPRAEAVREQGFSSPVASRIVAP